MRIPAYMLISLMALTAKSQAPVLTAADHPYAGLVATYLTSGEDVVVEGGTEEDWDLSGLWTSAPLTYTYSDPATAPGASNFPNATFAVSQDQSPSFTHYYSNDSTGIARLGHWYADFNSAMVCSDPRLDLPFPCTYGTTWTDANICSTDGGTPITHTVNWTCIGYGALHLPSATIWNTLLLESITVLEYDTTGGYLFSDVVKDQVFYSPGHPCSVAFINTETITVDNDVIVTTYSYLLESITNAVGNLANVDNAPLCWPTPADDVLHILSKGAISNVLLLDGRGAMIGDRGTANTVTGTLDLDTRHLANGAYVLRVTDADHRIRSVPVIIVH